MKPIPKQYDYFKVKTIQTDFSIEFETLKEMIRFAEKNAIKSVFILPEKNGIPEQFAFSNKGGVLQHATEGFVSLEEFKNSDLNGFPNSVIYNTAFQLGFQKYDEFKMSTETGITDAKEYDEIKKGGYIEAFAHLEELRSTDPECIQLADLTNANELRQYVIDKKFIDAREFTFALKNGFTNPLEYRESIDKGYKTYKDYKTGSSNGFTHGADYYFAKEKGIDSYEELVLFTNLNLVQIADVTSDQKIICIIISKVTDGKKTSTNSLFKSLQEYRVAYLKKDGTMPAWYTATFNEVDDLVPFLTENEHVKKYGNYYEDGEFFQNKKMQERVVILDGSNVAYGKAGDPNKKPLIRNILTMVKFLIAKGFEDITVFTDASLKHRFTDFEFLPELEKLCKFRYTPAEKAADLFLITYVKQNHCLIISNDKFRDWKVKDPWVATNIDYYRLTFMVEGDAVTMPDLE